MKKLIFLAIALVFNASAMADVSIRIPIIFEGSNTNKIYNVADIQKELKAAGLDLPEFVVVSSNEDEDELFGGVLDQVGELELVVGEDTLDIVDYSEITAFIQPTVKFPFCYMNNDKAPLKKAAKEAYELFRSLGDGAMSDQYSVWGVRYYGQKHFKDEDGNTITADGDAWDEDTVAELEADNDMKPGDVQLIYTTSDGGDDPAIDVLSVCK